MKRRRLLSCAALALLGLGATTEPRRAEFAYSMRLDVDGRQPAYQFALPLHVYQNADSLELADLRVLNGAGQPVPFALSEPATRGGNSVQADLGVPLFPLEAAAGAGVDSVRILVRHAGDSIEMAGVGAAPGQRAVVGYLLDTRALSTAIVALTPGWDESEPDFSLTVEADASDDLQHWRPVAAATLAHLHFNSQRFVQQRIDLPPTLSRYWRLSWPAGQQGPKLTTVAVTPAPSQAEAARSDLLVRAQADAHAPGHFTVDLGAHLPVDRVNLKLPELNTALGATLYSRADPDGAWTRVAAFNPYRLRAADGSELVNNAVAIARDTDRYWRIEVPAGASFGATAPELEVQWVPHTLSFLPRGAAPFELVYGRPDTPAVAQSAATMLAGLAVNGVLPRLRAAGLEAPQAVAGPRALAVSTSRGWRKEVLWGVLALGAVVLLAMAWQLLRELAGSDVGGGDGGEAPGDGRGGQR